MTGEWLIRQRATDRDGTTVERITIETTASGTEDPVLNRNFDLIGLWFEYADGRHLVFPHANILRAEYRPHNEP
jgi:hypothetical protein